MQCSNSGDETESASFRQKVTWLRMASPHQIASLIRSLDSQLISIEHAQAVDGPFLLYVFAVAGKAQSFEVALRSESLDSIVDLYPAALVFEAYLQDQFGLIFQPYKAEG